MTDVTVFGPVIQSGPVVNEPDPGTLLIVAAGAAISTASDTAILGDNWTVNVLGSLGAFATAKYGLVLGTPEFPTLSSVSIANGGEIFGLGTNGGAIFTYSRTNIVNKGRISGFEGIRESSQATGDYKITNSGRIEVQTVGIALDGAGTHTVVNSGTILVTTATPG